MRSTSAGLPDAHRTAQGAILTASQPLPGTQVGSGAARRSDRLSRLIDEEDVETPPHAAERLGISRKTVYAWIYGGKLMPYATVGRAYLLVCDEVDDCANNMRSHRTARNRHAREVFLAMPEDVI